MQACTCPSPAFWIMHRYEIILYGCMGIHSFCMGCCILQYYPRAALPHSRIAQVVTPSPHPCNRPCSPCNVLNPKLPSCPYPSAQEEANNLSSHYDRQISLQARIFGHFTHAHTRNVRIARLFIYSDILCANEGSNATMALLKQQGFGASPPNPVLLAKPAAISL